MPAAPAAAPPAACATPFRAAEKAFQLHREQVPRGGSGADGACAADASRAARRRGRGRWRVRPLDLRDVVDCGVLAAEDEAAAAGSSAAPQLPPPPHGGARRGVRRVQAPGVAARGVYALEGHPGAFVVAGALSAEEQARPCSGSGAVCVPCCAAAVLPG
jgi:hypothetical protein